jgi:hypothetical protein
MHASHFFNFNLANPVNLLPRLLGRLNYLPLSEVPARLVRQRIFWSTGISSFSLSQARHSFAFFFNRSFQYQLKLTKFVSSLYSFKVVDLLNYFQFNILELLSTTGIAPSKAIARYLLTSGLVFVNHTCTHNANFILTYWDFLYVYVDGTVISLLHRHNQVVVAFRLKFISFFFKYQKRVSRNFPQTRSTRIPNWLLSKNATTNLILNFVEIDITTVSFIVLKMKNIMTPLQTSNLIFQTAVLNIRNLNWKYLT